MFTCWLLVPLNAGVSLLSAKTLLVCLATKFSVLSSGTNKKQNVVWDIWDEIFVHYKYYEAIARYYNWQGFWISKHLRNKYKMLVQCKYLGMCYSRPIFSLRSAFWKWKRHKVIRFIQRAPWETKNLHYCVKRSYWICTLA